jgi:hypothetical protein
MVLKASIQGAKAPVSLAAHLNKRLDNKARQRRDCGRGDGGHHLVRVIDNGEDGGTGQHQATGHGDQARCEGPVGPPPALDIELVDLTAEEIKKVRKRDLLTKLVNSAVEAGPCVFFGSSLPAQEPCVGP